MSFVRVARVALPAALLFTAGPATAATDIYNGLIDSDTTWTAAASPYLVHVHVWVSNGVTLTIEPGVTVSFDDNLRLAVSGTLVARGTKAAPIRFTSLSNPAPAAWAGLYFTRFAAPGRAEKNGQYLDGCVLERCLVERAYLSIELDGSAPALLRTVLRGGQDGCLAQSEYHSTPTYAVHVAQCVFIGGATLWGSPRVYIGETRVTGYLSLFSDVVPGDVEIVRSALSDCDVYGIGEAGLAVVHLRESRVLGRFRSTIGTSGGPPGIPPPPIVTLEGGLFEGPVTSGDALLDLTGICALWNCVVLPAPGTYALRAGSLRYTATIVAENNYWGTTVESEIGERIWDFFDQPTLAAVDFRPFSTVPHWQMGDLDWDRDTDLADFLKFQACFTGSNVMMDVECIHADLDADLDVDLADFTILQANFTGSR